MKKHFSFLALLLLASCTLETEPQMPSDDPLVPKKIFHAVTESDPSSSTDTKVFADEDLKVLWNAGDRISIFDQTTYNHPYLFLGDDRDTAGDFEDQTTGRFITGNPVPYFYAVYPYSSSNKLDNKGKFTVTIPAEQSYKEKSFGIGANTMVAVSENGFLAFKNVGGYLTFRLYGDNVSVKSFTIQSNNGEKIAGKASVSMPLGGLPAATMDATATDAITIVCDPAVKIGESASDFTEFWFVIPPVTFSGGFTLTITDDQGGIFTKSTAKTLTIERNIRTPVGAIEVVPDYAASIIQFEDPDFLAALLELNIDTNGDKMISRNEAAAVEEITVCTDNISSLGGIEYFTNLKVLNATGSLIETKSSDARYAGQLESIELGQLFLLEELDVHGNKLEEIDVSNNPELNTLICTDNPLEDIILAPGQIIAQLESPEDTELVEIWGEGIDPASFPDPYFREYVFANFDTDGNGFLSEAECDAVTDINVCSLVQNIFSLEGIAYFKNLSYLACQVEYRYGRVSGGSHNWHLFNENDEEVIGGLTSLDISSNHLLEYLYCAGNQLTSITLNGNSNLKRIDIGYNHLTGIDVSGCPLLSDLDIGENEVDNLVLTSNPLLERLYCAGNYNLARLDLSNNPELNFLVCNNCILDILNVADCSKLTHLQAGGNRLTSIEIDKLSDLEFLAVEYNSLSSLDVSNNTSLDYLDCSYNSIDYLYLADGQEISTLRKDGATQIVYKNSGPAADEIWYTSYNGNVINPNLSGTGGFGDASVVSNTYVDGKGIIKFDKPLTTIGYSVFGYADFTSVTLPEGLTTIESYAFGYCQRMTSITFPSTLTSIGAHAIRDCYSLTAVTIPNSVETIEAGAFDNCKSLQSFNGKYASEDHRWLIVDGLLVGFAPSGLTSITLPSEVTEIETYTFHNCSNLTSVIIPEGVKRIGGRAFAGCTSLATVSIPESMETINSGAFTECNSLYEFSSKFASDDHRLLIINGETVGFAPSGLTEYTIPSSVKTIAYSTFESCYSLTSVTIPQSVTRIGAYAFAYCSALNTIIFDSATPPSLNDAYVFRSMTDFQIYVPASSVETYKGANIWSQFADKIQPRAAIPEAVDLGLSVKWASFNLGATAPEEYGDYYAWGETQPYYSSQSPLTWKSGKGSGYAWESYRFNPSGDGETFTKYFGFDTLQAEDDAASVNLGGTWRMPTESELDELLDSNNCEWVWTENYNNSGINGFHITSKVAGFTENSIFIPAAGFCDGSSVGNTKGSRGMCWSSNSCWNDTQPESANNIDLLPDRPYTGGALQRRFGISVRPVSSD